MSIAIFVRTSRSEIPNSGAEVQPHGTRVMKLSVFLLELEPVSLDGIQNAPGRPDFFPNRNRGVRASSETGALPPVR